ncbi:MAG: hypothetical protein M1821_006222 [Bathelium mastoideum]|nr:MAG: hypothetical protein M1821_006222 [Bathelium mastoideum]
MNYVYYESRFNKKLEEARAFLASHDQEHANRFKSIKDENERSRLEAEFQKVQKAEWHKAMTRDVEHIAQLREEERAELMKKVQELDRQVSEDIQNRDPQLPEAEVEQDRLGTYYSNPENCINLLASCHYCGDRISVGESFLGCLDCKSRPAERNGSIMCRTCYVGGIQHEHDNFKDFVVTFGHPRPIYPMALYEAASKIGSFDAVRRSRFSHLKDAPLATMLIQFSQHFPLGNHRFKDHIERLRNMKGALMHYQAFRASRNWAVACYMLADPQCNFGIFRALLSPVQRASFALLKEWWLSEIQDPAMMAERILAQIISQLEPRDRIPLAYVGNQKLSGITHDPRQYHGALFELFIAEFDALEDGQVNAESLNIDSKRVNAGVQACSQRLAYASLHPSLQPSWYRRKDDFVMEKDIRFNLRIWKRQIRQACAGFLASLKEKNGPEQLCWDLIGIAVDGPAELFVANLERPELVFGPPKFSACLAPMPWLTETEAHGFFPHFLWDSRESKTVETALLPGRPDYIAVSHTWGRWRLHSKPGLTIKGVPWSIPQNELWDVADLPLMLRNVPGRLRYIWFDLVCIPQNIDEGSELAEIERNEIAIQASIFGNAAHAVAWLNTVDSDQWESLQYCLNVLAIRNGSLLSDGIEWELMEELKPGISSGTLPEPVTERAPQPSTPLVRAERRSLVGTPTDPIEYVTQWFTSLWTLQEACMRPDMWLCDKRWVPLRLYNSTSWQKSHNVSLDGLVTLLKDYADETYVKRRSLDDILGRGMNKKGKAKATPQEVDESPSYSIDATAFDRVNGTDNWLRRRALIDTFAENIRGDMLVAIHSLISMFEATGIGHLLYTTAMDILVIADRRECTSQRAEAIMSVMGAVEWYQSYQSTSPTIMERYPLRFIENVRQRFGNGDFFKSRSLTTKALDISKSFENNSPVPKPIGTLLPFGAKNMFETTWTRERLDAVNCVHYESHPSLSSWRVEADGSVNISEAGIIYSTYGPGVEGECLKMWVDEIGVYEKDVPEGQTRVLQVFKGHPRTWFEHRKDTCFLVSVDWLSVHPPMSVTMSLAYHSHGLILRELWPGVLVKIGQYMLEGCKQHVFPETIEVDWRVL